MLAEPRSAEETKLIDAFLDRFGTPGSQAWIGNHPRYDWGEITIKVDCGIIDKKLFFFPKTFILQN